MLITLIPLFDKNMAVGAYSIFTQKNNFLLNPMMQGSGSNDGASRIQGLELIQTLGIETLTGDKEIFVPITNISVYSDIASQCDAPHNRIVLLIDNTIPPIEMYTTRLMFLKKLGYKLAIHHLDVSEFEKSRPILQLMDYVILNNKRMPLDKAMIYFNKLYPNVKLCAGNIETMDIFENLCKLDGYSLFEGDFYRVPVTKGQNEVAPLKVNYIELLNTVNSDDFELTKAADVIGRDTALTISLLKMVNHMSINSEITSIRHAAAMLGQKELKRWINMAVTNVLYTDKPNEITRVSMLRAKFAENLAECFGLAAKKEELFLMGLFSMLDVILEKPMDKALELLQVGSDIREALISDTGKYAPILDFIRQYESANWSEISRQMILQNISIDAVTDAYMESLRWYRKLTTA